MSDREPEQGDGRVRRTLIRVLSVQVVTLALLWLMQQRFGH